jgi:hypothetical protein
MPWEPSSAAAQQGNDVHALGEAIVDGREHECSAEIEAYRAPLTEAIDALRAEGWTLASEVPIAYAPATGAGRALPKGGHRAYGSVKPHEIAGTADIVGLKPGRLLVADFKTGRGAKEHEAIDTPQLRALAVGFAAIYGAESAEVALIHVEPGDYEVSRGELYAWDLEETAEQLRALALTEEATPRPGPHCASQWCPIRAVCPATRAALERIHSEAAAHFPDAMLVVDSDDKARAARVALRLYDEAAERLKESLHGYVRSRGAIDLGDGTRYGLTVQSRERVTLDADAVALLRDHGALDAVEYRTSKEAIKRALATVYPGRGNATKRLRALLDELRSGGHVSASSFERFDIFKNDSDNSNEDEGEAA